MLNGLHSFEDLWHKPFPRPAEYLDVVRATAVFDNADKLAAAAAQLQKHYGPLITFSNGMSLSSSEASACGGIRTIDLGLLRFNACCSWPGQGLHHDWRTLFVLLQVCDLRPNKLLRSFARTQMSSAAGHNMQPQTTSRK